jgi:penicillin-insensitive murein endopeptidase
VKRLSILLLLLPTLATAQQSTCYGTTSNGRLENGVQLPSEHFHVDFAVGCK